MSTIHMIKPESPYLASRIPAQNAKTLDTSIDSSWYLQIPDPANPITNSEYALTLNTEESMETFAEVPTPSNIRGFEDPCEALSPIKFNTRSNVFFPPAHNSAKAEMPKLRIGYSSLYLNNSENLQSKKFFSPCPNASKRIVKKNSGQVGIWSIQNLDIEMEEKLGNKEKNKKDLREDFKNFVEFRKSLKKEQGPTNLCQEMFKGFKISEVRSFLKSQITNA